MRFTAILVLSLLVEDWATEKMPDPVALISSKDKELQKLLKQKSPKRSLERDNKIKELINGIFDFQELGRKSLGKQQFESITPEQQAKFIKAFKEMIETSSLKKLEVYQSDSTYYEKPELKKGKAKVTAHTFFDGQESVLVYKLKLKDGNWRAWDLIIDDLSTYRNYKEQFKRILKTKTIDDLIQILEKKTEERETDDEKPTENPPVNKSH